MNSDGASPDPNASRAPTGRTAWFAAAGAIALAILATLLLTQLRPRLDVEADYVVFGTHARLRAQVHDRESAEAALTEAGQQLAKDHRSWHPWEASDLTALNDDIAAGRARRVDPALAGLIRQGQRGYRLSDGLFNPAAGRLIGAWGFHTSDYPVRQAAPSSQLLQQLLTARPVMTDLHVADDGTVRSDNRLVRLDLNAVAEGYAASQVRGIFRKHDIDNALLDIGGLLLAMGDDHGKPWRVGVGGPSGTLGHVELQDGETLSSSGDYARHRDGNDRQGHIIDTARGRPQRASVAASIISRDPLLADLAGTTLMVGGPERFEALTQRMGLRCAMLLDHDGHLHATDAMRQRLKLQPGYRFDGPPPDDNAKDRTTGSAPSC